MNYTKTCHNSQIEITNKLRPTKINIVNTSIKRVLKYLKLTAKENPHKTIHV